MAKKELIEKRDDGSKVYRETVTVHDEPKTDRQRRDNAKARQMQEAWEKSRKESELLSDKQHQHKKRRLRQMGNRLRGTQSGPKQVSKQAARLIQERQKKLQNPAAADVIARIAAQHAVDNAQR